MQNAISASLGVSTSPRYSLRHRSIMRIPLGSVGDSNHASGRSHKGCVRKGSQFPLIETRRRSPNGEQSPPKLSVCACPVLRGHTLKKAARQTLIGMKRPVNQARKRASDRAAGQRTKKTNSIIFHEHNGRQSCEEPLQGRRSCRSGEGRGRWTTFGHDNLSHGGVENGMRGHKHHECHTRRGGVRPKVSRRLSVPFDVDSRRQVHLRQQFLNIFPGKTFPGRSLSSSNGMKLNRGT